MEELEIFRRLEAATDGQQRTSILLEYLEDHPNDELDLSPKQGMSARLDEIDLNPYNLMACYPDIDSRPWWDTKLEGVVLKNANLENANLENAHLERADLSNAHLKNANLSNAYLQNANLSNAQLHYADLSNAQLHHANLSRANLFRANLSRAQLRGAQLENALLISAKLISANLPDSQLQGAILRSAEIQNANLKDANLSSARLESANLECAKLFRAQLQSSNLHDANLQEAELAFAQLKDVDLTSANLRRADLRHANLQGVDLGFANLAYAQLQRARLQGVNFSDCLSLEHIFLSYADLDRTVLQQEQLNGFLGDELLARELERDYNLRRKRYRAAKRGYLVLKQNFESLGDYDAASWAYRRERDTEKWQSWYSVRASLNEREILGAAVFCLKFGSDHFQELLCDYGESITRVLLWIVVVFLGFAVFYGLTGSVMLADSKSITLDPIDLAVFSLNSMTTTDTGNLKAAYPGAQVAASIEALLAIALTGLLGFVLGNRIRHS